MNFISYNYRGFGNPCIACSLNHMAKKYKPFMLFLIKTKLPRSRIQQIKMKIGYQNLLTIDSVGVGGGFALFWDDY